ncbi:MAG: tyrosine--tRNA ligase [Firmicutes bacterium]|nr:tyrosine--tRNA ligase [Bacillota bacterium]
MADQNESSDLLVRAEVQRQLGIIERGAVDLIPRSELEAKLEVSVRTGVPLRVKLGLDPTAPDLHIGHSVVLEKMRQLQELGHRVQIVIGDFTARIGDPSGRSDTRKPLTSAQVQANTTTYAEQLWKILDRTRTELHFNATWLGALNFAEVARMCATVTVARMLERDDFAKRFSTETPIGVHEFLYPLMQAYDSVALETDIELGGTDQTFNLLMGRTLQKEYGLPQQVVVTMPLLEGLDGVAKMSKSLGNYIGVDEAASEIYGKTMSIPDALMLRWFELLSGLPAQQLDEIALGLREGSLHPRDAKMRLALTLATRFAGAQDAERAQEEFVRVFSQREQPVAMPVTALTPGARAVYELLVELGLAPSNREARRLCEGGGVRVDGVVVTDPATSLRLVDGMVVQVGKRRFMRLQVGDK